MKDNLFEMLLSLFEKSLTQLRKSHISVDNDSQELIEEQDDETLFSDENVLHLQEAKHNSTRVFTYEEQMKLTKASYQFLMRMKIWSIIDSNVFEAIIHQLQSSESRIVTLQETKWTIRNILENNLNEKQLAFLDLVLYQTEDAQAAH